MSKSRFDNLELERKRTEPEPRPGLERFGADAPRPKVAQEGGEVATRADHLPKLNEASERFAASGDDGLALQLHDEEAQPFKRCPNCRQDSTRYETACRFCRTPLDTPEAIAFNEELWKRMRAEASAEQSQRQAVQKEQQAISQEQYQRLLENQKKLGQELERHYSGGGDDPFGLSMRARGGFAAAGVGLLIAARFLRFGWLSLILGGAGIISLGIALPSSWWYVLGRPRRRGPWL